MTGAERWLAVANKQQLYRETAVRDEKGINEKLNKMHNLNYCHRLILMVLSLVLFGSVLAELRIQDTRTTKGIPLQTTDNKPFEGIYKDAKVRFDLDESGKLSVAGKRVALCIYRGMTRIYPT